MIEVNPRVVLFTLGFWIRLHVSIGKAPNHLIIGMQVAVVSLPVDLYLPSFAAGL
jgi:hypothetical protein